MGARYSTSATADSVKPDISQPLYDQGTYLGRVRHMIDVTDARTLLTSDKRLEEAKSLLAKYEAGESLGPTTVGELFAARKLVSAVVHPDTGEKVLAPFRMSAFVPMNVGICAGLLIPNPAVPTMMFWQWVNQSYNVAVNHANRNASNEMSNEQIATAYGVAVTSSIGLALGVGALVNRIPMAPSSRVWASRLVPFVSVSGAGVINVFLMRKNEMSAGITVTDADGNPLGSSAAAGFRAISQVATSRVANIAGILVVPPILYNAAMSTKFFKSRPHLSIPLNLTFIGLALFINLPLTIALFPQVASMPVSSVESQFQNLKDAHGNPITEVYFNRGL